MQRTFATLAALVCLLCSPHTATAKETWTSVRTKNFRLVGNAGEKDIRRVATRLEQFRQIFGLLLPKVNFSAPVPTTVIVFKDDGAYKPFKPLYRGKPANVSGYFQPGQDVNYITLTAELRDESAYAVIFHEYVHLLVGNTVGDVPPWFNEGLAEYYSTLDVSGNNKRVTLGKPITNHVLRLREQFMPLADLFRVTHGTPAYNERDKQSIFYAESWALVHYLLQGDKGQRVSQLGRFSQLLLGGTPPEESFQQAFQTDFKTMEKALRQYVSRSAYPGTIFDQDKPLEYESEMESAPLPEAEALAYLGDLLVHINRPDDGEKYLQQALALAPDLASANAALGFARVRQNRATDAIPYLVKAVAADAQNYLTHYYYAYALSRAGMNAGGFVNSYPTEAARTMRAELKRAIELNPRYAEAHYLLGFVDLITGEQLDEAAPLLLRAQTLIPGRPDFALVLGQVYLRQQKFEAARRVLAPLANSGNTEPGLRAQAQGILASVERMESQFKELKAQGYEMVKGANGDMQFVKRVSAEARPAEGDEQPPGTNLALAGTDNGSSPNAPPNAPLKRMIPKRTDGEQVRGQLTRIECLGNGASVVFHVKAGERLYKIHADALERVQLISYVSNVGGEITCGPVKSDKLAVFTFAPAKPSRVKYDGEAVAVEFIAPDMEVEP